MNHKNFEEFRLQEIDDRQKHEGCMIHIENKAVIIPLNNCWASSRLDRLWRFEWFVKDKQTGDFHKSTK